jgi:hypothetical protein
METAAAVILQALIIQNGALKARIAGLQDPKDLEAVIKPLYKAVLSMVRATASEK